MPGFTNDQERHFDLWLLNEPDEHGSPCPPECENPSNHQELEYCPEEVATLICNFIEERLPKVGLMGFWQTVHDLAMDEDLTEISKSESLSWRFYRMYEVLSC